MTSLYLKIWDQRARWVWSEKDVTRFYWGASLSSLKSSIILNSRSLFPVHMMLPLTLRQPVMTLKISIREWQDLSLTLKKWSARRMTFMEKTNSSTYYVIRTNKIWQIMYIVWNQYCKPCFYDQNGDWRVLYQWILLPFTFLISCINLFSWNGWLVRIGWFCSV